MSYAGALLCERYRIDTPIAAGGAGEVWRATDLVLGRQVAVKLLRREYTEHSETLARFQAEARHAALLNHPGVVQVYDYGQAPDGVPFQVMELIDGPSLAQVLARGPFDVARVLDIVAQAAAALAVAHRAGLVHRDIKPANLLLAPGDVVKITDFGIAYAIGSSPVTRTGTVPGTPAYLAPERASGAAATAASDLYSLGVVAWECLTGTQPFSGTPLDVAMAHAQQEVPPLPPTVPPAVAGLVAELTAKDPAARPADAAMVAERAGQLSSGLTATRSAAFPAYAPAASNNTMVLEEPPLSPQPVAGRNGRNWRRTAALTAAGVAAAVLIGIFVAQASPGGGTPQASAGTHSSAPSTRTVRVNEAALLGRPEAVVLRTLRRAGLHPVVAHGAAEDARPGTVLNVQPAGRVSQGSFVRVTVATAPKHHPHKHDHHGHDHADNGDGNLPTSPRTQLHTNRHPKLTANPRPPHPPRPQASART